MKPIIGVSSGEIQDKKFPWDAKIYGQTANYTNAIIHAGGIPVIIPITKNPSDFKDLLAKLDGLLLSGGEDINSQLYKEKTHKEAVPSSVFRDSVELYFLEKFLELDKPIFGICRGIQLMNVYFGGTLYQDIPSQFSTKINHRGTTAAKEPSFIAHPISIEPSSKLAEILDTTSAKVNSRHHQAIKKLGNNLEATAWAEDNIIEAIEVKDATFAIGVQAHPEALEGSTAPEWQKMFKAFVEASKERSLLYIN